MKITTHCAAFPAIRPSPHGMGAPYWVREYGTERGGWCWLQLSDGRCLTVGPSGMLTYRDRTALVDGFDAIHQWFSEELPGDYWTLGEAECWQTGGMTMVDVLVFHNGWTLTLNNECAVLWAPGEEVLYDESSRVAFFEPQEVTA